MDCSYALASHPTGFCAGCVSQKWIPDLGPEGLDASITAPALCEISGFRLRAWGYVGVLNSQSRSPDRHKLTPPNRKLGPMIASYGPTAARISSLLELTRTLNPKIPNP